MVTKVRPRARCYLSQPQIKKQKRLVYQAI